MTACQTLAQSLSASPSATSYPTTQFSLSPSYHHEISDLSAFNRSFPSKIKCCVDRLSWLRISDNAFMRPIRRSSVDRLPAESYRVAGRGRQPASVMDELAGDPINNRCI